MGLLDEILKQLEEAQDDAQNRRPRQRPVPPRRPEREMDEDGAEWEEDETVRPSHDRHIPVRRQPERPAPVPEPAPARTTADSMPALPPHARGQVPAQRIRALVSNRESIRDVFIAREILGPPPGLRLMRRR